MLIEQLLNEISQTVVDYMPFDLSNNLDYIFGDKTRIAEKVDAGAKFKIPIKEILDDLGWILINGWPIDQMMWKERIQLN